MEPWVVGSNPSERFPLWTRANVGEVFPDPVAPLSFTLLMEQETEGGWRDALVKMGVFTHDEFAPGEMETLGIFGGYCYLNASVTRILGERSPGLSAQAMDDLFYGAQPGIPPYEAAPGDHNEERTAAMAETFQWVFSAESLDVPAIGKQDVDRLRAARPDFEAMTDRQLWEFARDVLKSNFRRFFGDHIFITFLSTVPVGALAQITAAVGRPADAMRLIAGVGDVESAAPSMRMWKLGRLVRGDAELTAAFNGGIDGLVDRLHGGGESSQRFLAEFGEFIGDYGARGPNEWEARNHTWETRPELALAAIDRMRLAGDDASPELRNQQMARDRERVFAEISAMLAGDPETLGTFQAATRAAGLFQAGRERTKTNCVRMLHEARMAAHTLGRRMVARGDADEVADFGLVKADEFDDWLVNPAKYRETIRHRRDLMAQYAALEEPFVFWGVQPDPSTWPARGASALEAVRAGDILQGVHGCTGQYTGIARVILDPGDPTALEPGDILVAPITDPSWTPLFVSAGAVVVDVGAPQSHAMIVSRELGIPCVPSVTHATRRIPDGATITVNGDSGTVTIVKLP